MVQGAVRGGVGVPVIHHHHHHVSGSEVVERSPKKALVGSGMLASLMVFKRCVVAVAAAACALVRRRRSFKAVRERSGVVVVPLLCEIQEAKRDAFLFNLGKVVHSARTSGNIGSSFGAVTCIFCGDSSHGLTNDHQIATW